MKFTKESTVAFIGDKVLKTPDDIADFNLQNVVRTELQFVVDDLIKEGKRAFLIAPEPGFAMLVAEVVSACCKQNQSIELHLVIPFPGHELCYSDADKLRYQQIYNAATDRIYIAGEFNEGAFIKQLEHLVSVSSEVVLFNKEVNPVVEELGGDKAWNMYEMLSEYFEIQSPVKTYLQDYPHVTSFKYGREGVIFSGADSRPLPVAFAEIEKIQRNKGFLCFFLRNGLNYFAALTSDEVRVPFHRFTEDC